MPVTETPGAIAVPVYVVVPTVTSGGVTDVAPVLTDRAKAPVSSTPGTVSATLPEILPAITRVVVPLSDEDAGARR